MSEPYFDPETGEVVEAGGAAPPAHTAMSLDDARAMLVREHGVAIGGNDPILMLVTLHQGMVRDYEAMLKRHDGAIQGFLATTGEACAQAVENVLAGLKDKTVKASLDQAFALVERQAQNMDRLERTMRRHRLIISLLTLLSMTGCGLAFALLFLIAR
jgi:hypothetical protein